MLERITHTNEVTGLAQTLAVNVVGQTAQHLIVRSRATGLKFPIDLDAIVSRQR